MNLSRLQTFCRVYEKGSFSQAAELLYLSQPTVSSHISILESELGLRLFDRLGRLIVPTQAGRLLYSHAREVLRRVDLAFQDIHGLQERVAGELFIGGSTIPGHYFLPQILGEFSRQYPEVSLNLQIDDTRGVYNQVLSGELDLGIIGARSDDPELFCQHLMRDRLLLLGNSCYFRGVKSGELSPDALKGMPWIIREKGSGTMKALELGMRQMGLRIVDLNVRATVNSTLAMLKCVKSGLGVCLTSSLAAEEILQPETEIVGRELGSEFERCFYLIRHKERTLSPAGARFVNVLGKHMESGPLTTGQNLEADASRCEDISTCGSQGMDNKHTEVKSHDQGS